ncbi:DHA2 family efflux MFS transporter permease subunit [Corynebacterium caspium]|uniref:DHA2 family efflux MFS transporter permease subunit n=1 Tax=Corynebacterium caspium TaxID=234828 RepID=UPI000380CA06|nr:DHA2 family efflux MFS transporter permease subunit [Corynebacterium caspium]WKD58703.1 putative multidrug resistance protein EmrY [Corynebacterium caspium DSM 44850]
MLQKSAPGRIFPFLGVLVFSAMVMILNETTLTVALPAIMAEFQVEADVVQWLIVGFLLAMAIVIPTTGFLLQRFSTRTLFHAAVLLFLSGCVVGALAPAFWVLVIARIIQACGTAIILPLLMTVTLSIVAPERRGAIMGINSVVISVAPALGPTLAGVILDAGTWHWLFWAMVPLALVALIWGFLFLGNVGETDPIALDIFSVILSALAFGAIVYGLSTLSHLLTQGDPTPAIIFVIGLVILGIFVRRQVVLQKQNRALLDMHPLTVRTFVLAVIAIMTSLGLIIGTANVIPIYMQRALGVSALSTGLVMLPGGLAQGLLAPVVGRLYDSFGPRPLAIPGSLLVLAAQIGLVFGTDIDTHPGVIIGLLLLFNFGLCLIITPMMTIALASLPQKYYGHGSAILTTLQQIGGAAGTALLVAAMAIGSTVPASLAAPADMAHRASLAFMMGSVLAAGIVVAVIFIKRLHQVRVAADEDPVS